MPKSEYGIVTESVPEMPHKATGKKSVLAYHVTLPTEQLPRVRVEVSYAGGTWDWKEFADLDAADDFMDKLLGHED